jgi:hypothetical protein
VSGAAAGAAVLLGCAAVPGGFGFLRVQAARNPEIESVAALPDLWCGALGGGGEARLNTVTNAYETVHAAGAWAATVAGCAALFVAITVGLAVRARRGGADRGEVCGLVAAATVCAVVLADTVFSPQYLVWVAIPVAWSACRPGRARPPEVLLLGATALTTVVFPFGWGPLVRGELWPVLVLTGRDALLAGVAVLSAAGLARAGRAGAGQADEARRSATC